MAIEKNELMEMAKVRGLNIADEMFEKGFKEFSHLILDVLVKAAKDSTNLWDDMLVVAIEPKLRDLVDKIEVNF